MDEPRTRRIRWPWAGVVAVLLVLVVQAWVLGSLESWRVIRSWLHAAPRLVTTVATDRRTLLEAREAADSRPLVAVVGSSRMEEGFDPKLLEKRKKKQALHFVRFAHVQLGPFETLALVPDLLELEPQLVVLGLSEFDTHGQLVLRPGASFVSFDAIATVVRNATPGLIFERRELLYQLLLANYFDLYHFRDVVAALGPAQLVSFPNPNARLELAFFMPRDAGNERRRAQTAIEAEFDARYPDRPAAAHRAQSDTTGGIERGPASEVQRALVARSVRELRESGVEVLVVELPLVPGAESLYDASIRDDFRSFIAELDDEFGIHFVSLDEQPRYTRDDFDDLIHLGDGGREKMTRVVTLAAERVVAGRAAVPTRRANPLEQPGR